MSIPDSGEREFVQSLAKGLAVIEAFGQEAPAMTLSEVARRASLTPGSARRVLLTLERLGYLGFERGRYSLLPRALRLGYAYLASTPLTMLAQPRLTQLTRELDESCSLATLDGQDVVIVGRATARRLTQDYMVVGNRFPAHATSFGKVLLAELDRAELERIMATPLLSKLTPRTIGSRDVLLGELATVRRNGWALNDQESILGIRSIAVPVKSGTRTVASLGFSTEIGRLSCESMIERHLPALRAAAESLSHAL